jgi:stage III sporulation protein AH
MFQSTVFPFCQERQDNLKIEGGRLNMNAKRQTIWLVSMLSLMVVLSAYYLFTEDVNKIDLAAVDTAEQPQQIKIDMSQIDKSAAVTDTGKSTASSDAAKSTTSTDAVKSTADKTSDTDVKVLQKVAETQAQAASASDYFTTQQMKNHEELRKKMDELLTTITDPKQKAEAVAKAQNEMQLISGQQEKIDSMEETLLKDYPYAVISPEGKGWKVTVQSQKLEKSQGVTIVDMLIKELDAKPENIKVQYVKP